MDGCVCDANLAPVECQRLYDEAILFEMANLAQLGRCHQLSVDAYGAQHADPSSIRLPYSLLGLHLHVVKGADGLRIRDVHQRMGKPKPWWPRFIPPPSRGAVTIVHLVNDGARAASTEGHAAAVQRWARSAWDAWADQHGAVAAFAADPRIR